jgi:hypothetical protein
MSPLKIVFSILFSIITAATLWEIAKITWQPVWRIFRGK